MNSLLFDLLNAKIAPYGKVLSAEIERGSSGAILKISAMLDGEKEPITIALGEIAVKQIGDRCLIKIGAVRISRAWLHKLAVGSLERLSFSVPCEFAPIVSKMFS